MRPAVRVPFDDVLAPVGVQRVEGDVAGIDLVGQTVAVTTASGLLTLPFDRLVFTLGSQVVRPNLPGLAEYAFDVDTYDGGTRLDAHLQSLPRRPESPDVFTVVVLGAGLTRIEAATSMPDSSPGGKRGHRRRRRRSGKRGKPGRSTQTASGADPWALWSCTGPCAASGVRSRRGARIKPRRLRRPPE